MTVSGCTESGQNEVFTSEITVFPVGDFTDPVTLTATSVGPFAQMSASSFSPSNIVAPDATAHASFALLAAAPPGIYNITVTGIGGGHTHTVTVTVNVVPDFALSFSPGSGHVSTTPGISGTVSPQFVTIDFSPGYVGGPITLQYSVTQFGVSPPVRVQSITADDSETLVEVTTTIAMSVEVTVNVDVMSGTPPGTYTMLITATNKCRSLSLTLPIEWGRFPSRTLSSQHHRT